MFLSPFRVCCVLCLLLKDVFFQLAVARTQSTIIHHHPPPPSILKIAKFALFEIIYQWLLIMWILPHPHSPHSMCIRRLEKLVLNISSELCKDCSKEFVLLSPFTVCFLIWRLNNSDGNKKRREDEKQQGNSNRLNKKNTILNSLTQIVE